MPFAGASAPVCWAASPSACCSSCLTAASLLAGSPSSATTWWPSPSWVWLARRKSGVFTGTLIAGFSRFLVHYVVGATVWAEYMPETFFGMTMHSPWFYSLLYNLAYMLPNIAITLLVFAVAYKPLKKYFTASDLLPSPAAAQPVKDPTSPKWDPER